MPLQHLLQKLRFDKVQLAPVIDEYLARHAALIILAMTSGERVNITLILAA
jgi:hypothetical protein